MNFRVYATMAVIAALSTAGQYLLKTGATAVTAGGTSSLGPIDLIVRAATNPRLLAAVTVYIVAFGLYMILLTKLDLSQALPATIGINVLFVAVMATYVLGENVTLPRVAGMSMIALGVYLVAR